MCPKLHTQYAMRTPNGDNRDLGCASRIAFVISAMFYAIDMISDAIHFTEKKTRYTEKKTTSSSDLSVVGP